jgi:tetratricopeptide (TPR) repeat protein
MRRDGKNALAALGLAFALLLAAGISSGVATAAEGPCALGDALAQARETKQAKKAYVEVLKQEPSSACAAEGLTKLNPPPEPKPPEVDYCAVGKAYEQAGRDSDAIDAYKKGLEKEPASECAKSGIEDAGPNNLTRISEDVLGSVPTALLYGGAILVLYYLLLFFCHFAPLKRFLIKWTGPFGRLVKHVLRPRLTFTDFVDGAVEGAGAPLTARVKERLGRMREEALKRPREYDLDFGTPADDFAEQAAESKSLQTALDSAGEVSEQTKIVAALIKILSFLLPIRRFAVSGTLDPPAKSGVALNLTLEEEGRSQDSTHLQGPPSKEDPKAPDFMTLAEPAAVWVQFGVACALNGGEWNEAKAESQALLREGLDLYRREKPKAARKAFEKAIVRDHTNWGAYVGLAVAEARLKGNFEESIKRILEGLEKMKKAEEPAVPVMQPEPAYA